MEPSTPLPIAQVNVGMRVVDAAGEEVGTVTAVQQPGTDTRPDAAADAADRLMASGYLRIDGSGFFADDTYASGDQVVETVECEPGVVSLWVARSELHRATD